MYSPHSGHLLANNEMLKQLVGIIEIVVDNDEVVGVRLLGVGHLALSSSDSLLQRLGGLGASARKSLSQLLDGRRGHKQISRVEIRLLDGLDALHINVQNALSVLVGHVLDRRDGGTVVVAGELRPLDEGFLLNELLELLHSHKVVVLAVHLAITGLSGGEGDGKAESVGVLGQQSLEQRGLAGSRGS